MRNSSGILIFNPPNGGEKELVYSTKIEDGEKEKGLQGGGSVGLLREKKQSQPAEGMGLRLMIEATE